MLVVEAKKKPSQPWAPKETCTIAQLQGYAPKPDSLQEMFGSPPVPYSVTLVNGKVDSYGRDAGPTQTRQPMPVIVPMVH